MKAEFEKTLKRRRKRSITSKNKMFVNKNYIEVIKQYSLISNDVSYYDITAEVLKIPHLKKGKVVDGNYFIYNGNKYQVDGKKIVLDYSKKEKDVAIWLKNIFGGNIYMCPRVNIPKNIQTPDYIWNGKKWDLKVITRNAISRKRAVDNVIKTAKKQTENIILDITDSKLPLKNIIKQVVRVYETKGREWVNVVIIKKNNDIVKIFKRK